MWAFRFFLNRVQGKTSLGVPIRVHTDGLPGYTSMYLPVEGPTSSTTKTPKISSCAPR